LFKILIAAILDLSLFLSLAVDLIPHLTPAHVGISKHQPERERYPPLSKPNPIAHAHATVQAETLRPPSQIPPLRATEERERERERERETERA
jgi:hypothetical protein